MADVSVDKKLKLANTRKRFKELQELKKKKNASQPDIAEPPSGTHTPVESLTSSTHSSINNETLQEHTVRQAFENVNLSDQKSTESYNNQENVVKHSSSVPFNYFNNDMSIQQPAAFFDSFSQDNQLIPSPIISNYFTNAQPCSNVDNAVHHNAHSSSHFQTELSKQPKDNDNYSLFPQQLQNCYVSEIQSITNLSSDDLSVDDPEIKQNEIQEYQQELKSMQSGNLLSEENSKELLNYLNGGTSGATQDSNESMAIGYEISEASNATIKEVQHSSIESVKHLSGQMAQMMEPVSEQSYEFPSSGSITDLEKRHLELVASVDREKMHNIQLKAINEEYKARIAELERELKENALTLSLQSAQELSKLKEELQAHIQTVGILYAEKTELSASLSQYELIAKQKSGECEELQARLKASRSRVADLEKDLNILKEEKSKKVNAEQEYNVAYAKLNEEYVLIKEQKEEYAQDLLEVREKLKNGYEENSKLHQKIADLTGKLSLADIKIQQLTSGESSHMDGQVERLTQDKFSLEKQVSTLNEMIKTITKERDESSSQYQLYTQQLNAQLVNLSNKITQLTNENETLKIQEQNRIKHIGELERQLQNVQQEQIAYNSSNTGETDIRNDLAIQKELSVQLEMEKTKIADDFTRISNEKELLTKELEAKNDSISQLESLVEQLRGNQPDSVKLLATIESDKVAAARAVQQNKELKDQLESMQEVFVKLSNDKLELTENLTKAQQNNKDIFEKLQKTELHLQTLADAIEIKDKELIHLRETCSELRKQFVQQEQLNDRLRHYEAQERGAHALQNDLQEARQTIVHLTNEINTLKAGNAPSVSSAENVTETANIDSLEIDDKVEEVDQLRNTLENQEVRNAELEKRLTRTIGETEIDKNDSNQNVLDKDNAMRHLEEKVKKTMKEIADLTEEKQRLEHIVLQLQGETETIGEYVALYQHQRMMLKQRALEKDQQLRQLANDRELIKTKLDKLNELIKKLVLEKGAIPPELLQHQESMNILTDNLCDEHSKMNEEINKMTENHIQNGQGDSTETAQEIIELLGEIKTSNLVQPDENYHHCPYCSGQLITV